MRVEDSTISTMYFIEIMEYHIHMPKLFFVYPSRSFVYFNIAAAQVSFVKKKVVFFHSLHASYNKTFTFTIFTMVMITRIGLCVDVDTTSLTSILFSDPPKFYSLPFIYKAYTQDSNFAIFDQ